MAWAMTAGEAKEKKIDFRWFLYDFYCEFSKGAFVKNKRVALISGRCDWCRRIWTGTEWLLERRPEGRETYRRGICNECMAIHFAGSQEKDRKQTIYFKPGPILLDR
jgi:hypothetical protein